MSITVRCKCGKGYRVGDDKAGMRMKCKQCGTVLAVPTPKPKDEWAEFEDDVPPGDANDSGDQYRDNEYGDDQYGDEGYRARRPAGQGRSKSKKKSGGISPMVWIGVGVGLLLLVGVAVTLFFVFSGGDDAPVAATDPTTNTGDPASTGTDGAAGAGAARPAANAGGIAAGGAAAGDYTSYMPAETMAAIVVRPQRLLASPLLESLPVDQWTAAIQQQSQTPVQMSEVELAAIYIFPPTELPKTPDGEVNPFALLPQLMDSFGSYVHTSKPVELRPLLDAVVKQQQAQGGQAKISEADFNGTSYFRLEIQPGGRGGAGGMGFPGMQPPVWCFCTPDSQTLLSGSEAGLKRMLGATQSGNSLSSSLAEVGVENDLVVAFTLENHRGVVADAKALSSKSGAPVPPEAINSVDGLNSFVLTADLTGPSLAKLQIDALSPTAAGQFQQLATQMKTAITNGWEAQKQQENVKKETPPEVISLVDRLIAGSTIDATGERVTINVARPQDLEQVVQKSLIPAIMAARAAAGRVSKRNNLKQIGLAFHNYHTAHQSFTPTGDKGQGLSWRVHLLPFLDSSALYNKFKLDEPWDSPHNKALLAEMPDLYKVDGAAPGTTSIMGFSGNGAAFGRPKLSIRDITDGTTSSILFVQAGPDKAVPWTKPEDLPFNPADPLAAMGKLPLDGFSAGMADSSVKTFSSNIDKQRLKALITIDGAEIIDPNAAF